MKPENAKRLPMDVDLSYAAMEVASELLPASKRYRLVVHPWRLRSANQIVGLHADVLRSNPLSPVIEVIADESLSNIDEWRLEAAGEVFWSPGA